MKKIKPCIFCDYKQYGVEDLELSKLKETCDKPPRYYVLCEDCHATGPLEATEQEAIYKWNSALLYWKDSRRDYELRERRLDDLKSENRKLRAQLWFNNLLAKIFRRKAAGG